MSDNRFDDSSALKEFLLSRGVDEQHAAQAATALFAADFKTKNTLYNITAADLRPPLSVPLSNAIVSACHQQQDLEQRNVTLKQEKVAVEQEKDALKQEKDALKQEKDALKQENDALQHALTVQHALTDVQRRLQSNLEQRNVALE
jgi:uncharacterized protein (DUF3084 family)